MVAMSQARFQGCRVPHLQGASIPRLQGSKIQGFRITWFQDSKVAFFLTTLPAQEIEAPNRIVVRKSLRLHWELHLQFPDVETLWTLDHQNATLAYCLKLVPENA